MTGFAPYWQLQAGWVFTSLLKGLSKWELFRSRLDCSLFELVDDGKNWQVHTNDN